MKILLMGLFILAGCKGFYDEADQDGLTYLLDGGENSYEASLATTDSNVSTISGTAHVDVKQDSVSVTYNLAGVPQNLTQISYGYIAADCSAISLSLPNDTEGTRTVNFSEETTLRALQNDLASTGAASSSNDINLANKSFIVKAVSVLATNLPGSNLITIACGPLNITTGDNIEVTDQPDELETQ